MTQRRTRITILSGFLGAGKTTLLNALLRDAPEPLGVIVNDFGAINIDAQLLMGAEAVAGEIALQNGCVCCSIRGDLLGALLTIMRRPSPPGHILIETSGVSNPAAVARTFSSPQLRDYVELSVIVVCVDPTQFVQLTAQDWALASEQVRVADFVLLTKSELASEGELIATRKILRSLAGDDLRIIESSLRAVPTQLLLDTRWVWTRPRASDSHRASAHVHEVGAQHDHHHHEGHAYETWTYRSTRPLSIYPLREALRRLPTAVFRAKGFVYAAEEPDTRTIAQVAGRRVELLRSEAWRSQPCSELVFLGPEGTLDTEDLQARLAACEASEDLSPDESFMREMVGMFERVLAGTSSSMS